MNITPEQARALLDGATPGPWTMHRYVPEDFIRVTGQDLKDIAANGVVEDGDARIIAAAPDLAQTIAKQTWEWGVQDAYGDTAWMVRDHYEGTQDSETEAREYLSTFGPDSDSRLVRRLVGPVEEVE
ncbi:hypothetical protein [Corynebacterium sp.]|uniref:hypothetical protein n=1 Tax=Corynebacterium sp. TaxID=1720 RepID=UPI0025C4222C|nr:hypothetical protein [Corynebacterium sp.]